MFLIAEIVIGYNTCRIVISNLGPLSVLSDTLLLQSNQITRGICRKQNEESKC